MTNKINWGRKKRLYSTFWRGQNGTKRQKILAQRKKTLPSLRLLLFLLPNIVPVVKKESLSNTFWRAPSLKIFLLWKSSKFSSVLFLFYPYFSAIHRAKNGSNFNNSWMYKWIFNDPNIFYYTRFRLLYRPISIGKVQKKSEIIKPTFLIRTWEVNTFNCLLCF